MADVLSGRDRAVYGKDDQGNSAQAAEAVRDVTANRRSRSAYKRLTDAPNREAEGEEVGHALLRGDEPGGRHADPVRGLDSGVEPGVAPSHPGKSANRRDRAAYNAYQREYMRKRRGS
jgi:hypothetical protein